MCLLSPAGMVRPKLRTWGSVGSMGVWGGTDLSAHTQGVRSHAEPRPVTLLSSWLHTAKSRSTLLFFPLGFLCVREPR